MLLMVPTEGPVEGLAEGPAEGLVEGLLRRYGPGWHFGHP
jgi:hypothetical protein